MAYQVKLKHLRVSARKARLVADLVRGKSIEQAQTILKFTVNKTAEPMLKLLNSGLANIKHITGKDDFKSFYISKILVNEGPVLKRMLPRAKGKGDVIKKRSSHIIMTIEEKKNESQSASKSV